MYELFIFYGCQLARLRLGRLNHVKDLRFIRLLAFLLPFCEQEIENFHRNACGSWVCFEVSAIRFPRRPITFTLI